MIYVILKLKINKIWFCFVFVILYRGECLVFRYFYCILRCMELELGFFFLKEKNKLLIIFV